MLSVYIMLFNILLVYNLICYEHSFQNTHFNIDTFLL